MIAAGRHSRFLQLAAQVAENSEQETKHGSLLVRGGKVLGSGHNSSRSRLQAMPGASNVTSLHSEVTTPPLLPLWTSVIVVLWFRANFALAAYFPLRSCFCSPAFARRWRPSKPFRGFYKAQGDERSKSRKPLRRCDLYVVRVLPEGRPSAVQGRVRGVDAKSPREHVRFGFSQPCVRCLRALEAFGVHRVIFSTGQELESGEVGCEVREVSELLANALVSGHCSRGDLSSVAAGAVRRQECTACV